MHRTFAWLASRSLSRRLGGRLSILVFSATASMDGEKQDDALDDSLDLYGDLSVDMGQELTYPELKKLYEESQGKVQELRKENQSLKDQNLILKKNISSLYLTAREEIQRKDAQIKSLQQKEVKKKFRRVQSSKEN